MYPLMASNAKDIIIWNIRDVVNRNYSYVEGETTLMESDNKCVSHSIMIDTF